MSLLLVYNPVAGSGSAKVLIDEHVLPALTDHTIDAILSTEHEGHAGTFVVDHVRRNPTTGNSLTIILASGDGTLHEIIDRLSSASVGARVSFILIPAGTANALYSSLFPPSSSESIDDVAYKLQSLRLYLSGKHTIRPLAYSLTELSKNLTTQANRRVASCVVTSTALHASILYDSELLRKEVPGIERFKVAAQQNSKRWYYATARLLPRSSGTVQIWDPASQLFINHPESIDVNGIVELKGPFIYFLSTVNVDRLEPEFRITPLAREVPSPGSTCDIVIVRPLRDPTIGEDSEKGREQFVDKIWAAMGGAYRGGLHINMKYDHSGQIVNDGDGPVVVEYIRCGGWEWTPNDEETRTRLVCADGEVLETQAGGKVVSRVADPSANLAFSVYCGKE